MQTLNNIPEDYRLTQYVKPFYEAYSVLDLPKNLIVDPYIGQILNMVHVKSGVLSPKIVHEYTLVPSILKKPENRNDKLMYIAFSGGKDCLATAIRAKQAGYFPVLVYVGGVNKSLPSEHTAAIAVAEKAGFPLVEVKLSIGGTKEYGDHPIKNILLLSIVVDEGLKNGCVNFSMGNLFEETASRGSLMYDFSDSWEMLRTFARMLSHYLPGAKLHMFIHDNLQSFYTVYTYDRALLPLLSTCITPDFRKPMIHKANVKKYGAVCVPENRCGNCYKCADEYRFKQAFGLVPTNFAFLQHCVDVNAKFDSNYPKDFQYDKRKYNRYGGENTELWQVLCDRCGHYVGRLVYDTHLNKFFVDSFRGSHHYESREDAQAILTRWGKIHHITTGDGK